MITVGDFKPSRESKGENLISFPDSYTVIDLETTGLSPIWDSIIELSAIKIIDGKIASEFSSLVNYESGTVLDDFISEFTGITQEMIDAAPLINSVLPEFIDFIGDDIVVGHNVNFDINFLYDNSLEFLDKPFTNNFVDTMRISRRLHPEHAHHRLSDLSERYHLDCSGAHRALTDCRITFDCFNHIVADILNTHSSTDDFISQCSVSSRSVRAKDIQANTDNFDPYHPFYQKTCVFTGTLEKMKRKDAMQIVANIGGINGNSVTKKTNFLILGNNDYCASIKDGKSSKQKKSGEA